MNAAERSKKGTWAQALSSLAVSILLVLSLRWLLVEPYVIPSGSMLPTLLVNDHIFVNKLAYGVRWPFSSSWLFRHGKPRRGDVVVFRSVADSGTFMVKRVIGLPGDRISIDPEGVLTINGRQIPKIPVDRESLSVDKDRFDLDVIDPFKDYQVFREHIEGHEFYTFLLKDSFRDQTEEFEVPPGKYFVMGDNRDRSSDSRFWGFLPEENLLGRASLIWFSCETDEVNALAGCSPDKVRYSRLLRSLSH